LDPGVGHARSSLADWQAGRVGGSRRFHHPYYYAYKAPPAAFLRDRLLNF
jgi:hypothetical protein